MDNGSESAFPGQELDGGGMPRTAMQWGLTKREEFAKAAMQGMMAYCGSYGMTNGPEEVAARAVQVADALLAELAKEQP